MNEPAFFSKLGQSGILRFDKGFLTILRKAASRTKRGGLFSSYLLDCWLKFLLGGGPETAGRGP